MRTAEFDWTTRAPLVPPRPAFPGENLSAFRRLGLMRRSGIGIWGERAYREDMLHIRFLGRSSFILNDPAHIRHVLVDNYDNYHRSPPSVRVTRPLLGEGLSLTEGKVWKHQRQTLAPAFTPRSVSMLVPHMLSIINETVAGLDRQIRQPVDLREVLQRMTLEIAGRTIFSFGLTEHHLKLRDFLIEYGTRLGRPHLLDLLLPLGWPTYQDIERRLFRRRWTRFMRELIADRLALAPRDNDAPRDLFDLMAAARDPETGQALSEDNLIDQVATMILASYETTATTLFWSLFLLAQDSAIQSDVAREWKASISDGEPDPDKLTLARAIVEETMRLYPPVYMIARRATGPDEIAGVPVKKGDAMLISPWLVHRREKLWPNADAFVPQRFLSGPRPDRLAYLPFGAGPRICLGAHFALVETTLALTKIVGRFGIELLSKEPVIPIGVVTTQPDRSPMFRITRRE